MTEHEGNAFGVRHKAHVSYASREKKLPGLLKPHFAIFIPQGGAARENDAYLRKARFRNRRFTCGEKLRHGEVWRLRRADAERFFAPFPTPLSLLL